MLGYTLKHSAFLINRKLLGGVKVEKRGRELDAKEAQSVLETTATRKSLVSWFDPFFSQMLDAVEKKKSKTILGGREFLIRRSENGQDIIFAVPFGFVPMTRMNLNTLRNLADRQNALATNQ